MAQLSVYLPPFAGDYSGAAGMLFGMDCSVVIVDASCCTRNYTGYDEPRWTSRRKNTFCAQLRTMESVLGDDARLLSQTEDIASQLNSPCIVLLGTPVPALVGMDLEGMAFDLESRCGVPVLGVQTVGFNTYEQGASLVQVDLLKRFCEAGEAGGAGGSRREPSSRSLTQSAAEGLSGGGHRGLNRREPPLPGGPLDGFQEGPQAAPSAQRVNILGACAQDFGSQEALDAITCSLQGQGSSFAWNTAADYTMEDVAAAAVADKSLVVSWSGIAAARWLQAEYGTPYEVDVPHEALLAMPGVHTLLEAAASTPIEDELLIVHDQVIANSLRMALQDKGAAGPITVASLFSMDEALMQEGDFCIEGEDALMAYVQDHPAVTIAGDPLLARVPGVKDCLRFTIPHEAVSSNLFKQDGKLRE